MRKGFELDGEKFAPAKIKILKSFEEDSIIETIISEGKNHQVKRMYDYIKHPVKKLKRISIGEIQLGGLELGNYRYLTDEEIQYLKSIKWE